MDEIDLIRGLAAGDGDPVTADQGRVAARAALCERIADRDALIAPRRRRRRPLWLAAAAGFAAAVAFLAIGLPRSDSPTKASPDFAAAAVVVAKANPRLLIGAPGWSIKHAYGFEVDSGSMVFGNGRHHLTLDWFPAHYYRTYLRELPKAGPLIHSTILGHSATTVRYPSRHSEPGADYETLFAPWGDVYVELRGVVTGPSEYQMLLRSLRRVDVDTWLGAMPPEVVQPDALDATVSRMLRGVPLPPDFDRATLPNPALISDRYRLATGVTGAVTCAWLERWQDAKGDGDRATSEEVAKAMATARHWPVLLDMAREKAHGIRREKAWTGAQLPPHGHGWASMIVDAADEIAAGHLSEEPGAYVGTPDGRLYAIGPAWSEHLGCSEHYRRPAKAPSGSKNSGLLQR